MKKRTNIEIDIFLKVYHKEMRERLERMTARKFTKDELISTKKEIIDLTKLLSGKLKELNAVRKEFENNLDPTLERGIGSKKTNVNLFDTEDIEETEDGIMIWNGDDIFDEEKAVEEE